MIESILQANSASDAGVPPGVTDFRSRGAQPFTDVFHRVGDHDAGEVLPALIGELARDTQATRCAMRRGKRLPVHTINQQGLWMPGVGHLKAVPISIKGKKQHTLPGDVIGLDSKHRIEEHQSIRQ